MNRFRASYTLVFTVSGLGVFQSAADSAAKQPGKEPAPSPVVISFRPFCSSFGELEGAIGAPSCGVPDGRQQAYDAKTGVLHIHFKSRNFSRSAFEVKQVGDRFAKPVMFRLTGVPQHYGCVGTPLALSAGGKVYALEDGGLNAGPVDKSLFKVERAKDVVTVEFTEKGHSLLKTGAIISFSVDSGW